jgi:predicted helicase
MVVSTTDRWSNHAEDALEGQQIPVTRLDVRMLDESEIDWSQFSLATPEVMERKDRESPRAHQVTAMRAVRGASTRPTRAN